VNALVKTHNHIWSAAEDMKIILWNPEVRYCSLAHVNTACGAHERSQTFEQFKTIEPAHKGKILDMIHLKDRDQLMTCSWDCAIKVNYARSLVIRSLWDLCIYYVMDSVLTVARTY
jgi:hypothetical protein